MNASSEQRNRGREIGETIEDYEGRIGKARCRLANIRFDKSFTALVTVALHGDYRARVFAACYWIGIPLHKYFRLWQLKTTRKRQELRKSYSHLLCLYVIPCCSSEQYGYGRTEKQRFSL